MRRFFAVTSILSRGQTGWMYFWPIMASLCVYVIALPALIPLFGAIERAGAEEKGQTPAPAPTTAEQQPSSPPNFSIAVGTDDEPREMPAIQSAMTDYLSFSDEFFTRLEQGAVAPDFSTAERELSPKAARAQVEDGASVLAVVLPKDLTPQVIDGIRAYYRGDIEAPRYTITILASPQALNEDKFILDQYRDQVIRQAEEHVSEQIRIVAQKFGCETGEQACPRTSKQAQRAFERPFDIKIEKVSGPPAVDYFSEGSDGESPQPGSQSSAPVAAASSPSGPADTSSDTDATSSQSHAPQSSISAGVSAIFGALILAAVTLAMLSSATVNRAAGLQVAIIGPWRSLSPQRPFPRRTLLSQKFGLAAAGTLALTTAATVSAVLPGRSIVDSLGAYPSLRLIAIIGLLCLVCLTMAIVILAVTDTLGVLAGVVIAVGAVVWGTVWNTAANLLDPSHPGPSSSVTIFISGNRHLVGELVPTLLVLLVILVAALIGSFAVTSAFDRRFSTQIKRS
ncbi:hypothetical protein [Brevibacterium aurantiacum]|uniref:Uncharacterized protein n=1 Tax=Brevibacterium aurantiacum TaxID=273384 RepID=A0A3Q9NYC5_BREAU|nr:hypothetical protein [Brevibacterium aurantiacum]AZT96426.1 hypothetical protein CXR27_04900 [Brevibacterium aurantiacum]